jgi:uncharacterized protein (TIGR03067 family)
LFDLWLCNDKKQFKNFIYFKWDLDTYQAVFQTQKLIITDSIYTLKAESVDKGTLKYKDGQMDINGKDGVNAGKHFTAIYKIENDQLTICYNLKGDVYPSNFETKSAPTFFLSVFKKQQP